tara:strand:+ start:830 stop:1408 length:579 start_codon:yes stop_codon:yes gene_type:complete
MESKLVYKNIFTDADCDWISQESKNVLDISNAITGEGDDGKVSSFRKSQTGFISYNNQDHADLWNYVSNALWNVVNDANRTNFGFDVSFLDSIQYTIYNEGGDHYDWHMDTFLETPNAYHRKLSVTVQLSNSNEYTGGDFELNDGTGNTLPNDIRDRGTVLVFPSFLMHRVTPVTQGTRETLVAWFEGRKFK